MHEFDLIERFFVTPTRNTEVGVGDDAAIIRPTSGTESYVAVDTLVNGVHFPKRSPAASVGYRSLAVNLSDLAAMGATPRWATIALTLPSADKRWISGFMDGFRKLSEEFQVDLIGGDTTSGPLSVTVQVIGEAPGGTRLLRSSARPGDDIYVTGTLGDAAAGLRLIKDHGGADNNNQQFLVDRFLWPTPRLDLCGNLRSFGHAVIDISDGFLADLNHILTKSQCGALIDTTSIPLSDAIVSELPRDDALSLALSGGDDYELCFTAPPEARSHLSEPLCTRIGVIEEAPGLRLHADGKAVSLPDKLGYRHLENATT